MPPFGERALVLERRRCVGPRILAYEEGAPPGRARAPSHQPLAVTAFGPTPHMSTNVLHAAVSRAPVSTDAHEVEHGFPMPV
jgi:hypothetical protein